MYRVTKYDASLLREKRGSHFFNRQYFNERKLLYILQLQLLTLFQLTVRRTQFTKLLHRLLYRNEETTKKKGKKQRNIDDADGFMLLYGYCLQNSLE